MDERTKGALQILFGILIGVVVLLYSDKIAALGDYGYIGVFLISLLSAATVFFPAPGWAVVISMGGVLNPYLVGIAAGLGSGIGELTAYMIGRGATSVVNKDFENQKELIKKYGVSIVFVLAFIPNPIFDIAGLAAGAMKIPVWKFLIACILGRTLRYILLAHAGMFAGAYVV